MDNRLENIINFGTKEDFAEHIQRNSKKEDLEELFEVVRSGRRINQRSISYTRTYGGENALQRYEVDQENYDKTQRIIKEELEELYNELDNAIDEDERNEILTEIKNREREYKGNASEMKRKYGATGGAVAKGGAYVQYFKEIINSLKQFWGVLKEFNDPWAKIDHAASQYSKTIGQTAGQYQTMRSNAISSVNRRKIGIDYNMSADELIKAQQDYAAGAGRNIAVSEEDQEQLAAMTAVYGGKANELSVLFEKFGVGLSNTGAHLEDMFNKAAKSGISLQKYTENVQKGLSMAQTYTFAGGLKSMERMAQHAAKIHMDMEQVKVLADKTGNVEGAVTTAAKLQVLGGQFSALADPLAMLSESWGDMEGLADRMAKITEGMGHFNKATGEVRVDAQDRQRLRAYAEATGEDYNQVMERVHQQAKLGEIKAQINSSSAAGLSDEMKELIQNTATFKDGKAGITMSDGSFKALGELTEDDKKELRKLQQTEAQDIKQIAKDLASLVDRRQGFKKQWENAKAWISEHFKIGQIEKGLTTLVGGMTGLLTIIAGGTFIGKMFGAGGGVARAIRGNNLSRSTNNELRNLRQGTTSASARRVGTTATEKAVSKATTKGVKKEVIASTGKKYIYNETTGVIKNAGGKQLYGSSAKAVAGSIEKATGKQLAKVTTTKVAENTVKEVATQATKATSKAAARSIEREAIASTGKKYLYNETTGVIRNAAGKQLYGSSAKAVAGSIEKATGQQLSKVAATKVAETTTKAATEAATSSAQKAASGVAQKSLSRRIATSSVGKSLRRVNVGRKIATKQLNKTAEKVAGKKVATTVGKTAAKSLKGGGIGLGIAGAIGEVATDALVKSGRIKKGGAGHTAMHVGSKMAQYAGMGAMFGPWGAAIGAGVGAIVGGVQMAKVKREMGLDNKLERMGLKRKGDYGANRLRKIDEALKTGKISNSLRRKMEREGDMELLDKIDAVGEEKKEKRKQAIKNVRDKIFERIDKRRQYKVELAKSKAGGDVSKNISKATFHVDVANFTGKAFGGEIGDKDKASKLNLISTIYNKKKQTDKNLLKLSEDKESDNNGKTKRDLLTPVSPATSYIKMTETIYKTIISNVNKNKQKTETKDSLSQILPNKKNEFGVSVLSAPSETLSSKPQIKEGSTDSRTKNVSNIETKVAPIDININGTLKLEGKGGQNVDILGMLKKDRALEKAIIDLLAPQIEKSIRERLAGGGSAANNQSYGDNARR